MAVARSMVYLVVQPFQINPFRSRSRCLCDTLQMGADPWHDLKLTRHPVSQSPRPCCPSAKFHRHERQYERSRSLRRLFASTKEEEIVRNSLLEVDKDQFPFSLPKRPKFQPFINQDEKALRMKAYRYSSNVKEGTLLVQTRAYPLLQDQCIVFSLKGLIIRILLRLPYKVYPVDDYLKSHIDIAPKAVILEALLLPGDISAEDLEGQAVEEDIKASQDSLGKRELGKREDEATDEPSPMREYGDSRLDEGQPSADSASPSVREANEHPEEVVNPDDTYSTFSTAKAQSMAEGNPDQVFRESADDEASSSKQVSRDEDDGPGSTGNLIGTVELSFASSTRQPTLTINPPKHQRRGYGKEILKAAEEVVRIAGSRRLWLHVRLKDEPAKALYESAGFELEKQDCILVSLFDDRRRLLSKFVPQDPAYVAQSTETAREEVEVETEY